MKNIRISDTTVGECTLTFKEKIETAKLLDRAGVSVIEFGEFTGQMAQTLLIKSVVPFVPSAAVAVCPGFDRAVIDTAADALRQTAHPRLQVKAALSVARMEYVYHKKAGDIAALIAETVAYCKEKCADVEFVAEDATRAGFDFLASTVAGAIAAGANTVTVCDTAGIFLPDEFAAFLGKLKEAVPTLADVSLGVLCSDNLHMATACAVAAIGAGADEIKVSTLPALLPTLGGMADVLAVKGEELGVGTSIRSTEIKSILGRLEHVGNGGKNERSPFEDGVRGYSDDTFFTAADTPEDVEKAVRSLGYDPDEEDLSRIVKAFSAIAQRKERVSVGELEAIAAAESMQVPAAYTLENYVVTTGNAIDMLAHIKLRRGDAVYDGLSLGDGPIDASFLAIEKITGHHYELDDFQIQAITEGREAMGQTVVKLRANGKVYAGRGISTDIIGSGIAAYVSALNKIIYEEENA